MSFTPEQVAELSADLHRKNVRQRSQSGRQFSYIEGWLAESEANRIFGFDAWDTETLSERCVAEKPRKIGQQAKDGWSVSYVCRVRVTVRTPGGGKVVREGVGAGHGIDTDLGLAHESALKEAATDAEKRALKTFGNPFGLALYDKDQKHVSDAPPAANRPAGVMTGTELLEQQQNGGGRKSSAQAKRDGDDAKIKADIAACDKDGLLDWHTNFDSYTAHLPASWLDSVRDMLESRLEELNGSARVGPAAEEMDEAFRQTMAGANGARVSGAEGRSLGAGA